MKKNTYKDNFRKYCPRLILDGIVKAVLFGLTVGFGLNFVTAVILWGVGSDHFWPAIGVGLATALISGTLSYCLRYRPNVSNMARRVDAIGLEERAITMLELENDDSYIAALQRKDTLSAMERLDAGRLKIRPSKLMVMLAVVFSVLGVSATAVAGLAAKDVIPDGTEIIQPEAPIYIEVTYLVYGDEGGEIIGEADQLILPGEDATPVVAVPFDGYVFERWTDSSSDPSRQEKNVTHSFQIHAFFAPIGDGSGEEGDGEPGDQLEEDGDSDENAPDEDQSSQDQENTTGESPDESDSSDADGSEGGGRWDDQNTIIDGTQYYYDSVETYKELAEQFIASNQEIPEYIKEFLETYYDGLS